MLLLLLLWFGVVALTLALARERWRSTWTRTCGAWRLALHSFWPPLISWLPLISWPHPHHRCPPHRHRSSASFPQTEEAGPRFLGLAGVGGLLQTSLLQEEALPHPASGEREKALREILSSPSSQTRRWWHWRLGRRMLKMRKSFGWMWLLWLLWLLRLRLLMLLTLRQSWKWRIQSRLRGEHPCRFLRGERLFLRPTLGRCQTSFPGSPGDGRLLLRRFRSRGCSASSRSRRGQASWTRACVSGRESRERSAWERPCGPTLRRPK